MGFKIENHWVWVIVGHWVIVEKTFGSSHAPSFTRSRKVSSSNPRTPDPDLSQTYYEGQISCMKYSPEPMSREVQPLIIHRGGGGGVIGMSVFCWNINFSMKPGEYSMLCCGWNAVCLITPSCSLSV